LDLPRISNRIIRINTSEYEERGGSENRSYEDRDRLSRRSPSIEWRGNRTRDHLTEPREDRTRDHLTEPRKDRIRDHRTEQNLEISMVLGIRNKDRSMIIRTEHKTDIHPDRFKISDHRQHSGKEDTITKIQPSKISDKFNYKTQFLLHIILF
jgi:hypothetical protein